MQTAVELYKAGYANNLLFSSGYQYIFKEALIMKSLAVSFGVPEHTIILEKSAKNTFENVEYTKNILDSRKWNKILLVSSPYHMKRAYLVFKKIAPNIDVRCTPITKSLFYSLEKTDRRGKRIWRQIKVRQIKGILHEYLGILYYSWRGWI